MFELREELYHRVILFTPFFIIKDILDIILTLFESALFHESFEKFLSSDTFFFYFRVKDVLDTPGIEMGTISREYGLMGETWADVKSFSVESRTIVPKDLEILG